MEIAEAQRQVRSIYIGGSVGQLIIGILWLASAALATWDSLLVGGWVLIIGGFFIYPLLQLVLRAAGKPASLPAGNPLRELAIEVALMVGPLLFLVGAATLHRAVWFFPSTMIVIGAHYLPFSFLYGMRQFIALGVALVFPGILIGMYAPQFSTAGAWFTGAALVAFAFVGRAVAAREAAEGLSGAVAR
ncbi:MAG TPA: hypothetical protein VJN21_11830 [Candidatus Acidoferrales bacterium]|nr:hypothetical protein [Candidatus Acidoferrales bacterium]